MQKTKDILKWYFSPSDFKYTAEHLFTENTKKQLSRSLTSLEKLIDRLPDGGNSPAKKLIKDVYYLFLNNYQNPAFSFNKRDVRILIWALDFQPTQDDEIILLSDKLSSAIDLFINNWKDSFIVSLWHVLIKNWTILLNNKIQKKLLTGLLEEKSNKYSKSRKDILKITSKIDLFLTEDSPKNYASQLLKKRIFLKDANELLFQKDYIISYDYFFYVGKEYIKQLGNGNTKSELILGIYQFLRKHNSKKTSMLLCSQIINQDKFKNKLDIVKNETVSIIGDPVKTHKWRYSELNEKEQQEIESARRKLNILLNRHFINIFFERLVQDERRKKYWLKFIDKIDDIKFSGNRMNYRYLKNIESVSKYVDYRYKITSRNQSTCALIIYSKDFVFVEFTDTGALYIYKNKNFKVNLNSINGMEDLKTWSRYDYACKNSEYSGYIDLNIEGRITHQGYWESRFDAWMRKYYHD